jgi:transposase-like protein/integrase
MVVFGRAESDLCAPDFPDEETEFQHTLREFKQRLVERGFAVSTARTSASRMIRVREIAKNLSLRDLSGLSFGEALHLAIEESGKSRRQVAREAGINHSIQNRWIRGCGYPSLKKREEAVPKIEIATGLPAGSLMALLPEPHPSDPARVRPWSKVTKFATRLQQLLREKGTTISAVARAIGLNGTTIRYWWVGECHPSAEMRATAVPLLEDYFELSRGELLSLLPAPGLSQIPYRLQLEGKLLEDFKALKRFKSDQDIMRTGAKPSYFWKIRPDGSCPSADKAWEDLVAFFGFAILAPGSDPILSGLGLPRNGLSMTLLAFPANVRAYLRFRKSRSGAYNHDTINFIAFVAMLLRARTGWLWLADDFELGAIPWAQLPEYPDISDPRERWRRFCEDSRDNLTGLSMQLQDRTSDGRQRGAHKSQIQYTRDYSHIQKILDMQHPINALTELHGSLLKRIEVERGVVEKARLAVLYRDFLTIQLVSHNPLRHSHFEGMKLGTQWRHQGHHLIRGEDGHYLLFFTKAEFKGLAGFRDADYEANIDPVITPYLDEYLTVHRPVLAGGGPIRLPAGGGIQLLSPHDCGLLLRPQLGGHVSPGYHDRPIANLSNAVRERIRKHIPHLAPEGFSLHPFRHVLATHLVKNHPDGFRLAADVLHNTEEMIRRTYGHLRSIDRTQKALDIVRREYGRGPAGEAA